MANIFNNKNELLNIIKTIFDNEGLRYITNEKKNPEITSIVNKCYYKVIASLCYSIIPPNINLKQKIELLDYIDLVKKAMTLLRNLNKELVIYSIEMDLIEEFIHIYETLALNDKVNCESLIDICDCLQKINKNLCSNEEIQSEELIKEYINLIDFLNILKNTDKNYYVLLKFIYFKEIKKVPNDAYRSTIFSDVLKNSKVIVNSNDILQILLFPLVKPYVDKFHESLNKILETSNNNVLIIIESILNKKDNEIYNTLSDTLIYYFEKNSFMYFNNIFQKNIFFENDEEKNNEYCGPLKLFKDS